MECFCSVTGHQTQTHGRPVLERNCPANMRMVTGTAGDRGPCGWGTDGSEKPYSNDSNYTLFSTIIKFVGGKQTSWRGQCSTVTAPCKNERMECQTLAVITA